MTRGTRVFTPTNQRSTLSTRQTSDLSLAHDPPLEGKVGFGCVGPRTLHLVNNSLNLPDSRPTHRDLLISPLGHNILCSSTLLYFAQAVSFRHIVGNQGPFYSGTGGTS